LKEICSIIESDYASKPTPTPDFLALLDFSLTKGFNVPEMKVIGANARIEFRMDAFNLFNLTNLAGTPTTSISSTLFGANTGALGSRTIELQSRFSF
jgi:hypothetical protein